VCGDRVVSTATTRLRKSGEPSGASTGADSYTGDTSTTVTSGVSTSADSAPWRLASRSPRFDPIDSTARRIGRISPVIVSASTMWGFGVSVTLGSALS
jgi:hypothetical protein